MGDEIPRSRSGRPPNNMKNARMSFDIQGDEVIADWRGMKVKVKFKHGEVRKAMREAEALMKQKVDDFYAYRRKKK